jgi:hypothetical protein
VTCQVLVAHPEALVQVHQPVLDEQNVQQVDKIGAQVHRNPGAGVGRRLEGKRRAQRYHPAVVEKGQGHDEQPGYVETTLGVEHGTIVGSAEATKDGTDPTVAVAFAKVFNVEFVLFGVVEDFDGWKWEKEK